jgi:uncharacterized protein
MNAKFFFAATLVALAPAASAQTGPVATAVAAGQVGEQADGYLGVRGTVAANVRAEVQAINIKRREAYTTLAGQRGVTVRDVAAAVGCTTLKTRVATGQAYMLPDGIWRVREGATAIELPAYCN